MKTKTKATTGKHHEIELTEGLDIVELRQRAGNDPDLQATVDRAENMHNEEAGDETDETDDGTTAPVKIISRKTLQRAAQIPAEAADGESKQQAARRKLIS